MSLRAILGCVLRKWKPGRAGVEWGAPSWSRKKGPLVPSTGSRVPVGSEMAAFIPVT